MAERGYTISLTGRGGWDRATIWRQPDGWYYNLRMVDPHGEEFTGDPMGPFTSSAEAELAAQTDFIPPPDE